MASSKEVSSCSRSTTHSSTASAREGREVPDGAGPSVHWRSGFESIRWKSSRVGRESRMEQSRLDRCGLHHDGSSGVEHNQLHCGDTIGWIGERRDAGSIGGVSTARQGRIIVGAIDELRVAGSTDGITSNSGGEIARLGGAKSDGTRAALGS
jgi:hypothetical protein